VTDEPARPGRLVLVATPIGNLGDLAPRAVAELAGADVICCEDTRHTRRLLTHAGVSGVRLVALHEHNEAASVDRVLGWLGEGRTVALVSDAGLPAISDPGGRLVAAASEAGLVVTVVPGPSAALAGLVVSGLATERFVFEGFLPPKGGERGRRLARLAVDERTVVLYEAPHRLRRTVADLGAACGPERRVALARELTKVHEEVWRGTLGQAAERLARVEPRGEYVVVVAGAPPVAATEADGDTIAAALARRLAAGDDKRSAVAAVAVELGLPKRAVYEVAVRP
jgi:16S rRNA (cytidine1402-2'-O)-methyltransferase